jgi:two-component system response regulator FlrC
MAWLKSQEWRGNVRELKNALERAVLVSSQPTLDLADFSAAPGSAKEPEGGGTEFSSLCLRDMEERLISRALEKTQGNRTHAARMLGISIRTLRNKLNEYRRGLPAEGLS